MRFSMSNRRNNEIRTPRRHDAGPRVGHAPVRVRAACWPVATIVLLCDPGMRRQAAPIRSHRTAGSFRDRAADGGVQARPASDDQDRLAGEPGFGKPDRNSRFRVVDRASGEVIGTSSSGQVWRMQAKGAWIDVSAPGGAAQGLYTGPIQVNPLAREGLIKAADRAYRGTMEVVSNKKGKLTVVNIIDVENYLRGVVPPEIGKLKEDRIEALKAQAVAARTYTVSNLGKRKALGFDLYGTVADQVYHGYSAEWPVADRAISETRGVIATYEGKPIAAQYSSTCAGETESIEDAWGATPFRTCARYGTGNAAATTSAVIRQSIHGAWNGTRIHWRTSWRRGFPAWTHASGVSLIFAIYPLKVGHRPGVFNRSRSNRIMGRRRCAAGRYVPHCAGLSGASRCSAARSSTCGSGRTPSWRRAAAMATASACASSAPSEWPARDTSTTGS